MLLPYQRVISVRTTRAIESERFLVFTARVNGAIMNCDFDVHNWLHGDLDNVREQFLNLLEEHRRKTRSAGMVAESTPTNAQADAGREQVSAERAKRRTSNKRQRQAKRKGRSHV